MNRGSSGNQRLGNEREFQRSPMIAPNSTSHNNAVRKFGLAVDRSFRPEHNATKPLDLKAGRVWDCKVVRTRV